MVNSQAIENAFSVSSVWSSENVLTTLCSILVDCLNHHVGVTAHPLGGGLQYRFKPGAEKKFRAVTPTEAASPPWRRCKFTIEGEDAEFLGWTDTRRWNGWAMPYFVHSEAQRVIDTLTDTKGTYDAGRDCFVSNTSAGEEEIWPAELITVLGGQRIKVYGIGAGAWIWDDIAND